MNRNSIFMASHPGRRGVKMPGCDVPAKAALPDSLKRAEAPELPEVSELDVVRHYTSLSKMNFAIDSHFYPLGSCTMKYNPKMAEAAAGDPSFTAVHPGFLMNGDEEAFQGALEVMYGVAEVLEEVTGMDEVSVNPEAGAHGEMLGIMLIAKYHETKGVKKKYVLVPDSSHGTNPATASMVGYDVITVKTSDNGDMDLEEFRTKMTDEVGAVMMTCPNTLGIFNPEIKEICDIAHEHGALVYYDGANLNAIMGKVRPGDLGFDVVHVNLHKTFATPHGGGGPGSGPVGVKAHLAPFLPKPHIRKTDKGFEVIEGGEQALGRITPFFGNFGIVLRAYAYMLLLGKEGLVDVSEKAVLNARYIMAKLRDHLELAYDLPCLHECVFSADRQAKNGVRALDIAKFLIDRGFHPPTVYFPLIVNEAIMIEPTETESKETIDAFCDAMVEACKLAETNPEMFANMPETMPISRPDETRAARQVDVCFGD